jgi:capsular exopolysaccharide synthesis family protein
MGDRASEPNSSSKVSVDFRSQLAIVRRYWWFTAMVLIAALATTFVLTQRQERIYSSSAHVLLRTPSAVTRFPFSSTGPRQLIREPESEGSFAQSAAFSAAAREQSPTGVSVSVRTSGNEVLFTARGTTPADVAEAATAWAQLYVTEQFVAFERRTRDDIQFLEDAVVELRAERDAIRSELVDLEDLLTRTTDSDQFARLLSQKVSIEALLQPRLGPIDQQISSFTRELGDLELITRFLDEPLASARLEKAARVPSTPVSPDLRRNLAVGALLGLALGIGLPYVWHALDDNIDDEDDVEHISKLPILGVIPVFDQGGDAAIEVLERPTSFTSARYQAVLTAIEFTSKTKPVASILFTSAVPGEGKTTTAVNIAALASKYKNVLLIDADMRRPRVHQYVGGLNDVGLSDVLKGDADVFDVRHIFECNGTSFDVLTAGQQVEDPALLLRGDAWSNLLAEHFLYDLIIIDGPPVLAVTDALLVGQAVDGQILLSRAGVSKREDLADATELLATNGARSLGVVINHERPSASRYADYSAYASST